ncbi:MAG: hypothetical protein AAF658_04395 [Myxococcota bacterium]
MVSADNPIAYALEAGRSLLLWGPNLDARRLEDKLKDEGRSLPVLESGALSAQHGDAAVLAVAVAKECSSKELRALGELVRERGARPTIVAVKTHGLRELEVDLREYFSLCVGEEG